MGEITRFKVVEKCKKKILFYIDNNYQLFTIKISKNLYCISKKSTKLDDLIDIDLVKGSGFPKNKTKLGLFNIVFSSMMRLAFLPFNIKWWQYRTNRFFAFVLLIVYLLQISNIYIYNTEKLNLLYKKKQV